MKSFILGGVSATAIIALTSFAYWTGVSKAPVAAGAGRTSPLRLADLTLDRIARVRVDVPYQTAPTTVTFPQGVGIVLTKLKLENISSSLRQFKISIDGAAAESLTVGLVGAGPVLSYQQAVEVNIDPPIVVHPGATLAIWQIDDANPVPTTISGYFVFPGEV